MKKTFLFLFSFFCTISLFSCSTNEVVTCYLPKNVTTSNSPLVPGGTLLLNASSTSYSDLQYNWSGPNNFRSNLQNPTINSVTPVMAGEYKLKTNRGICESIESTVIVEINAPNIPCNPVKNTISFGNTPISPLSFTSAYVSHFNDEYKIIASSLQATLRIEFARGVIPSPGIYSICSNCSTVFLEKDEVIINFNYLTYSSAHTGSVYISSSNGKLTAVFCNVFFQQSSFNLDSSASITEN